MSYPHTPPFLPFSLLPSFTLSNSHPKQTSVDHSHTATHSHSHTPSFLYSLYHSSYLLISFLISIQSLTLIYSHINNLFCCPHTLTHVSSEWFVSLHSTYHTRNVHARTRYISLFLLFTHPCSMNHASEILFAQLICTKASNVQTSVKSCQYSINA